MEKKKVSKEKEEIVLEEETIEEPVELSEEEETVEPEEVEEVETVEEEKPTKRPRERREGRNIVSRILNIVLWIVLFAWMVVVVIDFIHVHNDEKPQFCWFNEKTTSYSDGTVTECTGLGYKVINYNRESFKAIEFGPFWTTDRTADNK